MMNHSVSALKPLSAALSVESVFRLADGDLLLILLKHSSVYYKSW